MTSELGRLAPLVVHSSSCLRKLPFSLTECCSFQPRAFSRCAAASGPATLLLVDSTGKVSAAPMAKERAGPEGGVR